ncbi:MAG TPA: chloride channel protein [Chitinophagaceae bacterium]|nr:chloride channel protein [Chitinophagaceae bacterium]
MAIIISIRNWLKHLFDRISNEKLKTNLLQALPYWVASLVTGLVAVCYARMFAFAEKGTAYIAHTHAWWLFIVTPLCFIAAWWIVQRYAPYARGSGIPQVMASIELATPRYNDRVNKLLSIRIIVVKIISSLIMVLGGGIIGREGPTIQIAGSVFRKINQWLPAWWPKISKRNMIMTGAAAGLAAAFNTPLGGIVFAVEELTKTHISYFKTALFTAVIIAGLTAQALLGPYLYLGYPDVSNLSGYIFFGIVLVAFLAGITGSAMSKLILVIFRWKASFKFNRQHIAYLVACALAIAAIAVFLNERILGSGKELMTTTLFTSHKYSAWYMPLLRTIGPVLSFTAGAAGGVFAPALSAGASIGSAAAGWMHLSDSNTNLLILSGMVAFLTGVTRTPFTSAILVLEMTDRHNVIFHLMLAGMVSSLVSMLIDKHSFYDHLKHQYMRELVHETNPPPPEPGSSHSSRPEAG